MSYSNGNNSGYPTSDGVELDVVCGNVPVIGLSKTADFNEHVSWMVQTALDSSAKADSLYEYHSDRRILEECKELNLDACDVMVVRAKSHAEVVAVGCSGKRSVMLAVAVAMALRFPDGLEDLWRDLRFYKLHRAFQELLDVATDQMGQQGPPPRKMLTLEQGNSRSSGDRQRNASPDPPGRDSSYGITLHLIGEKTPVLEMDKTSPLHEYASRLLQLAADSDAKADSLYDYCEDRDIKAECLRLGLTDQDILVARVARPDLSGCKAVGSTGKRSLMVALVVSLVLSGKVNVAALRKEARGYSLDLEDAAIHLIRHASNLLEDRVKVDDRRRNMMRSNSDDDRGRRRSRSPVRRRRGD